MSASADGGPGDADDSRRAKSVRTLVACSGLFLTLQVLVTDYRGGNRDEATFWLLVGVLLLWMVLARRSRGACTVIIATSYIGAGLYASSIMGSGTSFHGSVLTIAYLGQALPLQHQLVRRHLQPRRRGDAVA